MPLLVPLAIALVIALTACLMWVWGRYLAHRAYATPVALAVAVLAAVGVALLVASDADAVPAAAGWAVLVASAVALVGGWIALATVAPAATERRRR